MGWLRRKKKEEEKPVIHEILLNEKEKRVFEGVQPKSDLLRDKRVEDAVAYIMDDSSRLFSVTDLFLKIKSMNNDDFNKFWEMHNHDIFRWLSNHFDVMLGQDVLNSKSKNDLLDVLSKFLWPVYDSRNFSGEDFQKALEETKYRFKEVLEIVSNARKAGVNTFISQTKLINIKPKIIFAETSQDTEELNKIHKLLDKIVQDLEYEKKLKKEEENAR